MFAGYNLGGNDVTRVGNWREELALKEATGCHRAPKPGRETRETSFQARLIEHTARVESKDYVSTMRAAHTPLLALREPVGKREALMDKEFRAMVDEEAKGKQLVIADASCQGIYETVTQMSFSRHAEESYAANLASIKSKKA